MRRTLWLAVLATSVWIDANGQTVRTGDMVAARSSAIATRLQDGRVLVTGGFGAGYLASAELFDPKTETFISAGNMHSIRALHTATLLQNGDVLLAGGGFWLTGPHTGQSAELYVAESGMFEAISEMTVARQSHTATLLRDGTVLITGGFKQREGVVLAEAEIYDPTTRQFTRVGNMTTPRYSHCAALLPDGRALIVGGLNVASVGAYAISAEIYDPETRTFERIADPLGAHDSPAVVLANGEILLVGTDDPPAIASLSEIYDPVTGTFRLVSPAWSPPWAATVTLLPGGNVLVTGGGDETASYELAIFDPAASTYTSVGKLQRHRTRHNAIVLRDGRVLLLGGEEDASAATVTRSAEIYGMPIIRRRSARR